MEFSWSLKVSTRGEKQRSLITGVISITNSMDIKVGLCGWSHTYIHKASPGIVPRNRADYQVLARRHILSSCHVISVVVDTCCEYDSLESVLDVVDFILIFFSRLPIRYAIVSTVDHSYDYGYNTADYLKNPIGPIRPDFNYLYFMQSECPGNISVYLLVPTN